MTHGNHAFDRIYVSFEAVNPEIKQPPPVAMALTAMQIVAILLQS
jgi:hypothetical protein